MIRLRFALAFCMGMLLSMRCAQADITTGLVARYNFENSGNLGLDSSGNGNNANVLNPSGGAGNISQAAGFVGSGSAQFNDRLSALVLGTSSTLTWGTAWTMAGWINQDVPTTTSEYAYLSGGLGIIFGRGWNNWTYYTSYDNDVNATGTTGDQYFWSENGTSGFINSPFPSKTYFSNLTGRWHHFVVTYDRTTTATGHKLYFDGKFISQTRTYLPAALFQTALFIGHRPGANGAVVPQNNPVGFKGKMDDVRYYDRALTYADVTELYQGTITSPDFATGLTARYDFETPANLGKDVSSNQKDASLVNPTGGAANISSAAGKVGTGSASFNDRLSAITLGTSTTLTWDNAFTVSLWFNQPQPSNVSGYAISDGRLGYFFSRGWNSWYYLTTYDNDISSTTVNDHYLWLETSGASRRINTPFPSNTTFTNLTNSWHLLTFTYDATLTTNSTKVYLDGALHKQAGSWPLGTTFDTALYFGHRPGANGAVLPQNNAVGYLGQLDDIRFYNGRALTASDVSALFSATVPVELSSFESE